MAYPGCAGEVVLDISKLNEGDYAGICAFQGGYGFVGVTKRDGNAYAVMMTKEADNGFANGKPAEPGFGQEWEAVPVEGDKIRLKIEVDFTNMKDEAKFYFADSFWWKKIGNTHKLAFRLDHFTGCRFGLFVYSTKQTGGSAGFANFVYKER